jgi:hypothetical protein
MRNKEQIKKNVMRTGGSHDVLFYLLQQRGLAHQYGIAGRDFFQNGIYLLAIFGID